MGTTKGTQQKVIVFSGELYTDAERIASAANSTVAESCTTPGTKTVANKGERRDGHHGDSGEEMGGTG